MALKYWLEFTDVTEIIHRVEISDDNFIGDSTQIYGYCTLTYSETKDTLEAIRGCGLTINLEADLDLTFYDLYSEDERTFSVVYQRNNEILFNGWLEPDGIYENLVTDKWIISLNCIDGIGFLNNLSYVEDLTGLNFVGKQSLLEIIVNCLKRTKTPQNILTNNNIYYDGLTQTLDTFANVYYNADRFVKDDGETIMNCDEVLRSVLEPFGCVLLSYKGEWLIYKPNTLFDNSEQTFFAYDSDGIALSPTSKTIDFALDLGSQNDNFYPHHVNANQQKTILSSIGAYRINYKYGVVENLLPNENLNITGGVVDDYTILQPSQITLNAERGFVIDNSPASSLDVIKSDIINIAKNTELNICISHITTSVEVVKGQIKLVTTDGTNTYSYDGSEWVSGLVSFQFRTSLESIITEIKTPPTLVDGDMYLTVMTNVTFTPPGDPTKYNEPMEYKKISIAPVSQNNLEGENHTFERILKPSSKIADTKEVFNGDNPSDIYVGTIYENNETTPTEIWTRKDALEEKPILQIMGEERMKMYAKPLQVYSGGIYGYFNYLSLITINNLIGKFIPTAYVYDCQNNVITLKCNEVLNTDILDDIDYEVTFDYGNVVEPTIKG